MEAQKHHKPSIFRDFRWMCTIEGSMGVQLKVKKLLTYAIIIATLQA